MYCGLLLECFHLKGYLFAKDKNCPWKSKKKTSIFTKQQNINPLTDMPILHSSNSTVNKDMI